MSVPQDVAARPFYIEDVEPILLRDEVINGEYTVQYMISAGSFGQVYAV
jgi:hypothetical protein